jgi:hypothetical protein
MQVVAGALTFACTRNRAMQLQPSGRRQEIKERKAKCRLYWKSPNVYKWFILDGLGPAACVSAVQYLCMCQRLSCAIFVRTSVNIVDIRMDCGSANWKKVAEMQLRISKMEFNTSATLSGIRIQIHWYPKLFATAEPDLKIGARHNFHYSLKSPLSFCPLIKEQFLFLFSKC